MLIVKSWLDVLVSLEDSYYFGSSGFAGFVTVASTHGSLNYRNSVSFIMSMLGPLPGVLRVGDVPKEMAKLVGDPWPLKAAKQLLMLIVLMNAMFP